MKSYQDVTCRNENKSRYVMVLKGNIAKYSGACIVDAANRKMKGGHGVDGAIMLAGGRKFGNELWNFKNFPIPPARPQRDCGSDVV